MMSFSCTFGEGAFSAGSSAEVKRLILLSAPVLVLLEFLTSSILTLEPTTGYNPAPIFVFDFFGKNSSLGAGSLFGMCLNFYF